MSTPTNAPYKIAQRMSEAELAKQGSVLWNSFNGTGKAVRNGKLNKKHGRRLTTKYA